MKLLRNIEAHILQNLATYYGRMYLAGMVMTVGGAIIVAVTQKAFPIGFLVLAGACQALYAAWKGSAERKED